MFRSRSTSENAAVDATHAAVDGAQDAADAAQVLRELPLDLVAPNSSQPRRHFDEEALHELAGSLSERGVLQPVLVHPLQGERYELLAGERRWRAAKLAGLQSIPALVCRYDELTALEAGLIENMARKDLNPVEEARACATLVKELGLNQGQVGRLVGRHNTVVSSLICLLELSGEILELLERGELSTGHGVALRRVKDLDARLPLARAAIEQGWTVKMLERHARTSKANAPAPDGSGGEQALDSEQEQDLAALDLARVWGDLLGVEVHVRPLPRGQLRIEVLFGSAAEGIALADRLAAAIARGSKGR
jgi:ParB family transcriptional regulator, chromosome partitioning protein